MRRTTTLLARLKSSIIHGRRSNSSAAANAISTSTPAAPTNARLRFAPSPTGYLHLGGLRTALFNHLLARKWKGKWILRIEDTDQNRLVSGAVDALRSTLEWAGLDYDEGVGVGGSHGPYIQSDRLDIYRQYARQLVENDQAYECFCSPDELQAIRLSMNKEGHRHTYDGRCRHLTEEDRARRKKLGHKYVVRFKGQADNPRVPVDLIYGDIQPPSSTMPDDYVILKSDQWPTYHLASVVDDHLMEISHVLRGEEWLPSVPKHHALYNALGWRAPDFAHLPLLINADGTKLSKRTGDVRVERYRDKGYEPEALLNFLALMGWDHHSALADLARRIDQSTAAPASSTSPSPSSSSSNPILTSTDSALPPQTRSDSHSYHDLFTIPQLISAFSLDHVNHKKAAVNLSKLDFLNKMTLRRKAGRLGADMIMVKKTKEVVGLEDEMAEVTEEQVKERKVMVQRVAEILRERKILQGSPYINDMAYIEKVMDAELPRITLLDDIGSSSIFFFLDPQYNNMEPTDMLKTINPIAYVELVEIVIAELRTRLAAESGIMSEDLGWEAINAVLERTGKVKSRAQLLSPMRHALTGRLKGPSVPTIMAVLGAERSLARLEAGLVHVRRRIRGE